MRSVAVVTGAYNCTGQMVFQQDEVEEATLDHFDHVFDGSIVPVFPISVPLEDGESHAIEDLNKILYSSYQRFDNQEFEKEVCSRYTWSKLNILLDNLNNKSCGVDQIPNELLKYSSIKFKQYLLSFLNHIMEKGRVPEELNSGKCFLIYKGGDYLNPA